VKFDHLFNQTIRAKHWRLLGSDNNDRSGDVFRSRLSCSLEPYSNLMTRRGDHKVRMTYHSQLSSPAAADLDGFVVLGLPPFWQQVAVGAVLIGAVYFDQLRRKLRNR
jgi:hypothetical protein